MCADGQNHRLVTLFVHHAIDGKVLPQRLIELDLHTGPLDVLDLNVENVTRKTIFGNTSDHHATCYGKLLKYGDFVALLGQAQRGRQTCRSCADNGHPLESGVWSLGSGVSTLDSRSRDRP
ncbi:MAG: hypothetical protein DDT24_00493 [Chloroflexi bacterium]|nr:hypothetical protein [Chloroflexota bacterium]